MPSIFISGGAAGIGRATALRFLAEGWTVGVYDLNKAAVEELKAEHPGIVTGTLDVRDYSQWEAALADFAQHTGGKITVLDNNAGVLAGGDLETISAEQIKLQIDVDVTGVAFGAKAALPYLKGEPGAHLVNISSASSIYGQPSIATYSAAKFFVTGFTEALELEWAKHGVRVVAIWPLWAKTELVDLEAKSTRTLGVNITPEQVADQIWNSVHPGRQLPLLPRVHYSVGLLTTVLTNSSKFAPRSVVRLVNRLTSQ